MKEFWHKFQTEAKWFLGTLIVIFVLILFLWKMINQNSFMEHIQSFVDSMFSLLCILTIFSLMILGIKVIITGKWPWSKK